MRALRAQHISRDTLPYKAMWQPWFAWYGLFFNVLIVLTQGFTAFLPWSTQDFFVAYVSVILFVVLYIGHKVVMRTSFVKAVNADVVSGAWVAEEKIMMHGEGIEQGAQKKSFLGNVWSIVAG